MLDKTKPYGEVFGLPGVRYVQYGVYYKGDGTPVISQEETLTNEEVVMPANLGRAKNETLKALMEQADQDWVDRKSAIAWLKENG